MSDVMQTIPVAKPTLGKAEEDNVLRVLRSGWITQGPEVAAFEREFAAFVGAPHACAVANCTVALHLALMGVGVGAGDEVITVSHSYIATANSVRYCDAKPVFIDIDPATFNMDPTKIEAAITAQTKAILCVHQIGMPCDLSQILAIARSHHLPVVEDAACAIGSEIDLGNGWEKVGKPHGDVACFSFHPRKILTTGDGGMLTTANVELDRKFRLWRQHGMSVTDTQRHSSPQVIFEEYPVVGYNYRMTDLQAGIGRAQLTRVDGFVQRRRELVERYRELLADTPQITLPQEPLWAKSNWQSVCVRLPETVGQKDIMQRLLDIGISTRRGVMNAHREAPYASRDSTTEQALLEGERAQDRCVILPLFHEQTETQIQAVCTALKAALRG